MNMNEFAREITKAEGLRQSLSIAQVKEVIRLVALAIVTVPGVAEAIVKYGTRAHHELEARAGRATPRAWKLINERRNKAKKQNKATS